MCCACGGGSTSSSEASNSLGESYAYGIVMITLEMIGWIMFYIGYKGSINYARFLIDEQEGDLIFDNFSINADFDF